MTQTPPISAEQVEVLQAKLKAYDKAVDFHSYRPHDVNREAEQHKAAAKLADAVREALTAAASIPARGVETEGAVGWETEAEWKLETDAFNAANNHEVPECGVTRDWAKKGWAALIRVPGEKTQRVLGVFPTKEEEAAEAYRIAALVLHKDFVAPELTRQA